MNPPLLSSTEKGAVSLTELTRRAGELSVWFTEEGLRGATAGELFEGYCRRLSAMNFVIMRAYVSTQTLHPQWTGYGYTWRRELSSVREQQFARGPISHEWMSSPFNALIQRSLAGEKNPWLRRRLELGPEQRDFPVLAEFYAAGATDYVCVCPFSFVSDRRSVAQEPARPLFIHDGSPQAASRAAEIDLLRSTLPGLSLAMKAHTGHDIASGLLRTYLGSDAGSRVHSGAVERGTVEGLRSVLWYADLRGFTRISDVSSGAAIVDMLNDTFEILTAALRSRGGHVLKFIGDALLATISFDEPDEKATCRRALDAAVEASAKVKIRNLEREVAHVPFADVDIALHVGEVLYGNVGAVDRLDFTVIGPAVNEVVRMEKLCEPLGQQILFSSRFAEAAGRCDGSLESLGHFQLRGVDEAKEIFGLRVSQTVALQREEA